LQIDRGKWDRHLSDDAHVKTFHDRPLGLLRKVPPRYRVPEEIRMEKRREALGSVKRNTAKVLSIDGRRNIVWDNSAPPTGSHDRNQHIAWMNGVAAKLAELRFAYEATFPPAKLVLNSIVDSENSDAVIGELAM
jgi:hypothetical protein